MTSLHDCVAKLPTSWRQVLEKLDIPDGKELTAISEILPTYPSPENIFRCFTYFDPSETRVVILGQDPYHGPCEAIGLCFGVDSTTKLPPSLRNIEKVMMNDLDRPIGDYTLESWAKQGVLLLNAALTVRHKSPSSHMKWWIEFTRGVIRHLDENYSGIVFVAWGAFAHQHLANIDTNKHHLLVSSHPSPLSYKRSYKEFPAFETTRPFTKINSLLKTEISW